MSGSEDRYVRIINQLTATGVGALIVFNRKLRVNVVQTVQKSFSQTVTELPQRPCGKVSPLQAAGKGWSPPSPLDCYRTASKALW